MKFIGSFLGAISLLALATSYASAGPKEHVVQVVSDYDNLRMYFKPKMLHIDPGDTVVWENQVAEEHNIITFPDGFPEGTPSFQSPMLKDKAEKWSRTFPAEGTYEYHCLPHLPTGMHGTIVVGKPTTADRFHQPSAAEIAKYRKKMFEYFEEDEIQYKSRLERRAQSAKTN